MIFVKLLMKFLFSLLFNKGEYEVSHKNFNPIRLYIVTGKQIGRASCRERVLRLV